MEHKAINTGLELYEASLLKSIETYRWLFFFTLVALLIVSLCLAHFICERNELIDKIGTTFNSYDSLKSNMLQQ